MGMVCCVLGHGLRQGSRLLSATLQASREGQVEGEGQAGKVGSRLQRGSSRQGREQQTTGEGQATGVGQVTREGQAREVGQGAGEGRGGTCEGAGYGGAREEESCRSWGRWGVKGQMGMEVVSRVGCGRSSRQRGELRLWMAR